MHAHDSGPGSRARRAAVGAAISVSAIAFVAFAALALPYSAARASLTDVAVTPESPTICDSTTIRVAGTIPDSCHRLLRSEIQGPVPDPYDMGILPAYRFRAVTTLQEANPELGMPCTLAPAPYAVDFPIAALPFGRYHVDAVEYIVPYSPDGSAAPTDSTFLTLSFTVTLADSCGAQGACVLLSFLPANAPPGFDPVVGCAASALPGGTGCFAVGLMNPVPVGGVQLEFQIADMTMGPLPAGTFTPLSVETTDRTKDFTLSWTADGPSVKAILYSATGAAIAPGNGPILRACYGVSADTREISFPILFGPTIVADSNGDAIPFCPTFAVIQGWFCVGAEATCDLNRDGRSDILDVVHLVRCALLGAGSDACPDSVASRADCNGDGALDVRDVICCVRKILAGDGFAPPPAGGGASGTPTRIGFAGPAIWTTPVDGRAEIEIEPASGFAGAQFTVAPSEGIRIRGLTLLSGGSGATVVSQIAPDGAARAIVYLSSGAAATGGAAAAAGVPPIRLAVSLEPSGGSTTGSSLSIAAVGAAAWSAAVAPTETTRPTADVPATAVSAAAVYPARPNPFASETELSFALPAPARVSLRIYDVAGRLVRTLVDGAGTAGVHRVPWDGRNESGASVGSGIYFVRFSSGGITRSDRLLKLR
ncbi:MAG TPA: FlgD immunoglobulin-like domain containing protein [Candidatus Eisenbacteria bacterium]